MSRIYSKKYTCNSSVFKLCCNSGITLFGIFLLVCFRLQGQQVDTLSIQYHKTFSKSIIQGSYDDLKKTFDTYKNDKEVANFYGKAYLKKAKNEKDTVQIANGYDLLFKLNFSNHFLALKYVDSIIIVTKNSKHEYYPSKGYLNKGSLLVTIKKYKQALECYLIAQKYARINKNVRYQIAIAYNIGRLKYLLNRHEQAIQIFKENLNLLEYNFFKEGRDQAFMAALIGLSESYNKLKKLDSADFYIRRGIQESFKRNYKDFYGNFLLASGINNTLRAKQKQALDTLYKAEKILPNSINIITKSICRTYIAKNLLSLNRKEEAIVYLRKIDSTITSSNYFPDVRDAFELLIDHYKEIGDRKNQLRLLEKLIELDKLTSQKHKELSIDIVKKYDTELLIKNRDLLVEKLAYQKEEYIKRNVLILISVLSVSILFFIWYFRKQKIITKKIIEEKDKIIRNKRPVARTKIDTEISHELLIELSEKLKVFENSKGFLDSNISMVSMAKQLDTNSTYLSRVINKTTGKNFANYLNDLRIEYTIEKLNDDLKYRLYSITAIAQEVGFNNSKSFSRAFFKKTGKKPSLYIKNIELRV